MSKFRIKEVQIDSFNDTYNKFQEFDEGLNIICGRNEAGKSTMMDFIKNIFTKKSSSGKGYLKCEHNGADFRLISGDTKKLKENEKYLSNINPREFNTGFVITLDDIMFAQKTKAEDLINTIKDSSGNLINSKQEEYYNFIHSKQDFALTPTNAPSVSFKKQFDYLKDLDKKIKELTSKEEEYNSICKNIENLETEIGVLNDKYNSAQISLLKTKAIEEKLRIKINEELISKKTDFEKLREDFGALNIVKSKENELKNRLELNQENINLKIKEINKLENIEKEDISNFDIKSEDIKKGKELADREKELNFEKQNIKDKLAEKDNEINQQNFIIQTIENKLISIGIEDIKEYKNLKSILSGYKKRYSELLDKSYGTNVSIRNNNYNQLFMFIFGAMLCACLGSLFLYWNSNIRWILIALILSAAAGLNTTIMYKLSNKYNDIDYKKEMFDIEKKSVEIIKKTNFAYDSSVNLTTQLDTVIQQITENLSKYENINENLLNERVKLEKIKSELEKQKEKLENTDDKIQQHNKEKDEFLKRLMINKFDNFEEVFGLINDYKELNKEHLELQNQLKNIDDLTEKFTENLNRFINEADLKDFISVNKYDFGKFGGILDKIGDLIYKNMSDKTIINELDTKINEYETKLNSYKKELITDDIDENYIENIKSDIENKTNDRGMLLQQKYDLEQVSELVNLKNKKNIELNRIKSALSNLIQKEIIYGIIQQAKEEFNSTQPNLLCAKEYFSKITCGKYNEIDFETKMISGDNTGDKDWDELSRGTKEQLYLALRLGYAVNYSKDKDGNPNNQPDFPIIIDDAFVNFDNERTTAILKCLSEFSENNQVLYFTCHSEDVKNILKKYKVKHNLIEL